MPSEVEHRVSARLARIAAAMRAGGVRVGLGELLTAHAALAAVDAADRAQAYHALRAALCASREDYAVFDAAFAEAFGDLASTPPREAASTLPERETSWVDRRRSDDDRDDEPPDAPAGWSDLERLREADFGDLDREDLARAAALMAALARRGPTRRSRRLARRAHRHGGRGATVDVRRTIRHSMRSGGEPVRRLWRERSPRPRRLVIICDTSGSMRPYADGLLLYVQALVAARRSVEAFVFGTRLTRVTAELGGRDGRAALARLAGVVEDFGGGTRIGESLRALNCEHGDRIGRGATVILLSDGWDRGATDELADELARLRRTAHRLVWLNPLKARPGYEPLTGGMAAALPHLDAFLAGNSVASLEELADLLTAGLSERDAA
jgi:uncharacterized protein with von Willebrand factor type A (vWA) domain